MDYRQNQQYSFSYQSSPPYNGTTNDTSYIPGVYAQTPLPLQMNAYQNNQHAGLQLKSPAGYSYEPLEGKSTNRKKTWKQMHLSGWRFGTLLFSLASLVALLLNVAITIYSVSRYGGTISKDFEPIFVGNCAETKSLNTWIHLAINILSSILLSGSNYCMQVMTAPSRKDVDEAHTKRKWLDIGTPSLRNLRIMTPKRRALWAAILLTSAPLHLVYNSVFSQSWTRQAYEAALVTPDFIDGAPFVADYYGSDLEALFEEIQANSSTYQRLEPMECLKAYNKKAILDRKTVLVVTSLNREDGSRNSVWTVDSYVGNEVLTGLSWSWMCDRSNYEVDGCDLTDVLEGRKEWKPFQTESTVDYCLSEYLGEQCTLDFSFGLMMVVCVCNLVKLICMALLYFSSGPAPLLNIGDAVRSFLDAPDETTKGMCLAGKREIAQYWDEQRGYTPTEPLMWVERRIRWFKACSAWRWIVFTLLSLASITTATVLLGVGLSDGRSEGFKNWSFGVASIYDGSPHVITYGHELYQPTRLAANILLANLPQLIISFLFFAYNNIITCMAMAAEWSNFAHDRKTLRVSAPIGQQRSNYYLQLPYRYAVPLLLSSMLLHWLTSQAIFLDRRIVRQVWWGRPYTDNNVGSVSTVGYSPVAVIFCVAWGIVMLFALAVLGHRKYKPGIPLAASCSAAISAACHPGRREPDASVLPILWGVESYGGGGWAGHCSFSSLEVTTPIAGNRCAGSINPTYF